MQGEKPFFPHQVSEPVYVKSVARNQTFEGLASQVIDAEERNRQGTPALSANQQGLAGKTGKDLCTGSALS